MNIFKWVSLAWKTKGPVEDVLKEAKTMNDANKPGWKTTEFWLTVLGTNVPALVGMLSGVLDPKWGAVILAASNGTYAIIRAWTKQGGTNATA